jgi:hypothetical protein
MVLPVFAYLCRYQYKFLLRWILFSLPPIALLLAYNYLYLGSILDSGYGTTVLQPFSTYWSAPFLYGFLGILASPSKGLFIYSPVLLFAFVGIYSAWKHQDRPLLKYLSLGPILVLVLYGKWHFWWGGETYGPRLIADIAPLMCFYLFPVWQVAERRMLLKIPFIFLALLSLVMHAVGAFTFEPSWYKKKDVSAESDRLWSWQDNPFLHYGERLFVKNASFLRTGISALPTSPQMPHMLAGSLVVPAIPSHHSATEPIRLSVSVTNTSPAIWLFQTSNGQDSIRLGWRWVIPGTEMAHSEGRLPLIRDVFPGEQEKFDLQIWPPSLEGQYTLELGMVSEPTTWFAVKRFPIQIIGNCYFEDVLNEQIKFIFDSPQLTIGTDKFSYLPGEIGKISLNITNGVIARNLKFFTFLKYPDGRIRRFNSASEMPKNPPCSLWARTSAPHILSRRFKIDWQIGLRLNNMPAGVYTLYTFMTEPNDIKIVARASLPFRLIENPSEDDIDSPVRLSVK